MEWTFELCFRADLFVSLEFRLTLETDLFLSPFSLSALPFLGMREALFLLILSLGCW